MIADSGKNIFDIVLVHKLDRFSRDRYDSAIYKSKLKKNRVSVASVLERIDDSPESVIMESMLEGMAEYYSKNLSREVMKGMKENALQGKHTGGTPPLGYDLDAENHLVINEHEAEAIIAIFQMYGEGLGYSEIISWLNSHGYTTKRGTPFLKTSLVTILANEKYAGVYVYNQAVPKKLKNPAYSGKKKPEEEIIRVPGACPAIISHELFDKVQKRKQRNRERMGSFYSKELYLVSGKVICGICGRIYQGNLRYSGQSHTRYAAYRCETHKAQCGNKEMNKDYLDAYIIELLRNKVFNKRSLKKHIDALNRYISKFNAEYDEHYETIKAEYDELTESLANITAAIERGVITDSLIKRAEDLESQRTALLIQMTNMHQFNPLDYADYEYLLEDFRTLPHNSEKYRALIQQFILRINVYPYRMETVLNLGFGITDTLTETIEIRRGDLYAKFKEEPKCLNEKRDDT
ncbi:MAG: recombinase family protein [Ruminococcus sp.]|nr:recombinase family protein [Ruminococcus sp.]